MTEADELEERIERLEAVAFRLENGAEKAAHAAEEAQEAADRDVVGEIVEALDEIGSDEEETDDPRGYW